MLTILLTKHNPLLYILVKKYRVSFTGAFAPPPPPLIWPHSPGYGDLHVNHLVSLQYNIHIVTNHTMYIHTLVNVPTHG